MQVQEIMKENAAICSTGTNIKDCANLMVKNDCGEIPVVESEQKKRIIGVITDRDIACRVVAKGVNPAEAKVEDYMTKNIFTVKRDDDLEQCQKLMSEHQVRRLPVVDENMNFIGIVSHSHAIQNTSEQEAGKLEKNITNFSNGNSTQNLENI